MNDNIIQTYKLDTTGFKYLAAIGVYDHSSNKAMFHMDEIKKIPKVRGKLPLFLDNTPVNLTGWDTYTTKKYVLIINNPSWTLRSK